MSDEQVILLSVPAEIFAGGAGIDMTVRQLGGTLGVALLAALVGTGGNRDAAEFTVVWIAGAVAGLIAAAGGVALLRVGDARAVGSG